MSLFHIKISITTTIIVLLAWSFLSAPVSAAKLYKWVDKDGKVSYSAEPPKGAKSIGEVVEASETESTRRASAIQNNPVVIYTLENCEDCQALLQKLKNWKVAVQERSLQDREIQARLLAIGNGVVAPSLFIGDRLIKNLSEDHLIEELDAAGYLIRKERETPYLPSRDEGDENDDIENNSEHLPG